MREASKEDGQSCSCIFLVFFILLQHLGPQGGREGDRFRREGSEILYLPQGQGWELTCFMSFLWGTPKPGNCVLPPPPDDVTFGKMAFRENVQGTWKIPSFFLSPGTWEKFRSLPLYIGLGRGKNPSDLIYGHETCFYCRP